MFEETVERLGHSIKLGLIKPGQQLPPERELAELIGVSRVTVRSALQVLVQGGFLIAKRGRNGGTFVVDHPPVWNGTNSERPNSQVSASDAAAFSDLSVANTVAALPTVLFNGATATIGSNGEYSVSAPTRVTVDDARVGSSSSRTVDASGASTSASMSIHTITASKYDVTFTSAPVGGLTTINLGGTAESPLLVIKLRWQNSESVNETPEVVATDARTKNVDGEGFPNALDLDSYVTKVSN
jgi:DNA-binding transcriptional regulator YhcF (GntR family)